MAKVILSIGTYRLTEPDLDGWADVLETLRDVDYEALAAVASFLVGMEPGTWTARNEKTGRAALGLAQLGVPLVRRSPHLAAALMRACLRADNEEKPTREHVGKASAADVMTFVAELVEQEIFAQLVVTVKNVLAPALEKIGGPEKESETPGRAETPEGGASD